MQGYNDYVVDVKTGSISNHVSQGKKWFNIKYGFGDICTCIDFYVPMQIAGELHYCKQISWPSLLLCYSREGFRLIWPSLLLCYSREGFRLIWPSLLLCYSREGFRLIWGFLLKQLSSKCSKNKRWKIIKLTVNTGQVMFSGEFYLTDPLIQLTKSLVKYRFSLHNLLYYLNAVAVCIVGISWCQKRELSVFKAKKRKF